VVGLYWGSSRSDGCDGSMLRKSEALRSVCCRLVGWRWAPVTDVIRFRGSELVPSNFPNALYGGGGAALQRQKKGSLAAIKLPDDAKAT